MWHKKEKGVTPICRDYTNSSKKILTTRRHLRLPFLFFEGKSRAAKAASIAISFSVSFEEKNSAEKEHGENHCRQNSGFEIAAGGT